MAADGMDREPHRPKPLAQGVDPAGEELRLAGRSSQTRRPSSSRLTMVSGVSANLSSRRASVGGMAMRAPRKWSSPSSLTQASREKSV